MNFNMALMKSPYAPITLDVPNRIATELRPAPPARASGQRGTPIPYDFRHPTKLAREHVRLLQMAYETFARRLTTVLTSGLRQVCQEAKRLALRDAGFARAVTPSLDHVLQALALESEERKE